MKKTKIGLVQINNSFSSQNYFPYSTGLLQAYAEKKLKNIGDFEFLSPIYKRIPIEESAKHLSEADAVFFSTYVWNFRASSQIAEMIKKNKPETLTVFGGCRVPQQQDIETFLREVPYVDIVCHGEGEGVFVNLLDKIKARDFSDVLSISFINKHDKVIKTNSAPRISQLDEIPSPYLLGTFDKLIKDRPEETWIGLWETNRGCPFACSFCEWGGHYEQKMNKFSMDRLNAEAEWFGKNGIEFIFCCDSNFGIFPRDFEIVENMVEIKKKYGYPKALSVQNTKNSSDKTFEIQKLLDKTGLSKGVNLAFQSLYEPTLKAVGRKNIRSSTFHHLQKRFNLEKIATFSDIILGLPEETYDTFVDGVSKLIAGGQHNRIQFNNLSILPNSEMAYPEYQEKYGIKTIETELVNIHGSLDGGEINETQQLVIGTRTMPLEDWARVRAFSWMTSLLYFDKLLQIPFTNINAMHNVDYKELISGFENADSKEYPVIADISRKFIEKAKDMQKGGSEYCESKEWLNIWWPADELTFIELYARGKLDKFYNESESIFKKLLQNKGFSEDIVVPSVTLNKSLIKLPGFNSDFNFDSDFNIWEFYNGKLSGENVSLINGRHEYKIDRTSEKWDSIEDWCKKVVWYGNKKGDYMYSCK